MDSPATGVCTLLYAADDGLFDAIADAYVDLVEAHGAQNVLVLKRHPAGLESVRTILSAVETADGTPVSPRVESLPEHASKVIEEYDPTLERLEYEERIELISLVIEGASREMPAYLEHASDREGFTRDVGRLLLEATRQRVGLEDPTSDGPTAAESGTTGESAAAGTAPEHVATDCLAYLYAINDRFHDELADRGYVERAAVIPRAVDLLEDNVDGLRDRVTAGIDAVLAIELEEYRALDRRYLATLTADADLVCVGERDASIERTRVEPGCIEDLLESEPYLDLELEGHDSNRADDYRSNTRQGESTPSHRAVTRFLATGDAPRAPTLEDGDGARSTRGKTAGRIRRIRARTSRRQVDAVAREVQSLRERHDWPFDAFAVAVPSIERVPETRRRLRDAGLPTATIGTPALAENPAVGELYAVVRLQAHRARTRHAGHAGGPESDESVHDCLEAHRDRLRARVDGFSPELLERCREPSVSRSIDRWIEATDLKGRIATAEEWVDAREQYDGVRRVRDIARFVEETDLVGPDWEGLERMLERTIRYDAPYAHAVETSPPTGGVTVCPVGDLKYERRRAVFVLDVIDAVYPGEQFLTQLFPSAWLGELLAFPAVTDPDHETVADTFGPADADGTGDPFVAYHAERARRRLALATRAATDACYLCSYERGHGGLARSYDESRYLKQLAATPGLELVDADAGSPARYTGEARALEAILEQPRGELERVLREASTGGSADLAETEALFQEIALVLEAGDVDDDLRDAVHAQFEFAAGEVAGRD
ncbi:hypothetical protein B1756_17975 [Natrarchaeobaculum aegyptiacum]|uniref:Uncharacterized protein n=2 Tax=Natrarchaeobaculum aegyptiacum TaxID=745377 RepID=A0A2Z2HW08_9EURY|nr:hypothetical protein [Natrarchaeobaculum aegyptiacum]ARS91421.1 hypothetical protein B1756_17975 [Natrarchaeobaculum aegyptiacum]